MGTGVDSAGDALMLAKQGGLDLTKAFEAIAASSGNSFVHETESQVILSGSYNIGFTLALPRASTRRTCRRSRRWAAR